MKFASCLLFCSIVTSIDILATYYNELWIAQFEGNPIQRWIMVTFGVCTAMAIRCGTSSAAIVFLLFLRKHRPRLAILLLSTWIVVQLACLVSIIDSQSIRWHIQIFFLDRWGIVL